MIVGIYDDDLLKHPKSRCGLNLELMKISAYHKNKGDIVVLSPTYSPEKYSVFYYGKEEFCRLNSAFGSFRQLNLFSVIPHKYIFLLKIY